MAKLTLDYEHGRKTEMAFDDSSDAFVIQTKEDATPVLDANKRKYNDYGDKLTPGKRGEWHHAASIPATIWEKWIQETNGEIQKDPKLLARYLNDPDNKYFKTAPTNL